MWDFAAPECWGQRYQEMETASHEFHEGETEQLTAKRRQLKDDQKEDHEQAKEDRMNKAVENDELVDESEGEILV